MRSVAARRLVEPEVWQTYAGPGFRPAAVDTYGPIVADLCAAADFAPDPQQELILDLVFAVAQDLPASFATWVEGARQAFKTGTFIQVAVGWIYVDDVREVLWTAHEVKTSADSMESFHEVCAHPKLSRLLPTQRNRGKYDENGDERVEFSTGQSVSFRTRTKNGARGIARVKKLIVDEAAWLTPRQQGAMFPIVAAKQGEGQIVGGSSAPPIEGAAFREIEDRGTKGAPRMNFLKWAAKREACDTPSCEHPKDALERGIDCALDREHLILQAYPTIHRDDAGRPLDTGRITMQTVRDLRGELPPEEYMRECMVWRDEPDEHLAIIAATWWREQKDPTSKIAERLRFMLEVSEEQDWAAIAAAGVNHDGRSHVEVTSKITGQDEQGEPLRQSDYRPGSGWVVDRLTELKGRHPRFRVAIFAGSSGAVALKPDIEAAGVPVDVIKGVGQPAACSYFVKQSKDDMLRHLGQTSLTLALASARKRTVGDGAFIFGRRSSVSDICPLNAAAGALWLSHLAEASDYDVTKTIG